MKRLNEKFGPFNGYCGIGNGGHFIWTRPNLNPRSSALRRISEHDRLQIEEACIVKLEGSVITMGLNSYRVAYGTAH